VRLGWALVGVSAAALAACTDPAPAGRGAAWPEANALFHRDARFLGADGAYSVDLGGGRVLWLFGDTLVARDRVDPHATAAFLRNSVALQTGYDPLTAYMRHYWKTTGDDPTSFFPEPSDESWLWPAHGARVGDRVVLFFELLHDEGEPGPWSFVAGGWTAAVVDNPDDAVSEWRVTPATLPEGHEGGDELLGEACVVEGETLYAFGTRGDTHEVVLARFDAATAATGDLSGVERYCGGDRWAADCAAQTLFSIGAPEFSVHWDPRLERWLWVASGGFGAAPVIWRAAPTLTGPWSDPTDVFRPPEASRDGAFVYAAKAHPELDAGAGGELVVTYVPSSFEDAPASLDGVYYFPFFAKIAPE